MKMGDVEKKIIKGPHLMLLLALAHRTECVLVCFNLMKHLKTKIKTYEIDHYLQEPV